MTFDQKTVYLTGWHMHFAAEHQIDGTRATAEMHLVHADAAGNPAAVVGIMVDVAAVGAVESAFLPTGVFQFPASNETRVIPDVQLNMAQAIQGAGNLTNFWTYEGSLTTPPCSEGLRWYVSSDTMRLSQTQFDAIKVANGGIYSARTSQAIKNQRVNQ
jgi:carbonic anhydrase